MTSTPSIAASRAMRTGVVLAMLLASLPVCAAKLAVGAPAPSIDATLLDGSRFSLAETAGKVVIVNVWATWCAPCRQEMPALDAFYRAHRDEGLVLLAVSLDQADARAGVRQVAAGFAFPAALAADTRMRGYGRLWHVPLTFVIDRRGMLRRDGFASVAPVDAALLERDVLPLLHEPAP